MVVVRVPSTLHHSLTAIITEKNGSLLGVLRFKAIRSTLLCSLLLKVLTVRMNLSLLLRQLLHSNIPSSHNQRKFDHYPPDRLKTNTYTLFASCLSPFQSANKIFQLPHFGLLHQFYFRQIPKNTPILAWDRLSVCFGFREPGTL